MYLHGNVLFTPMIRTINKVALSVMLVSVSGSAFSHGYVIDSGSGDVSARGTLCKFVQEGTQDKNYNCGSVQWEPQSLEGFKGFPKNGPADGRIASAGLNQFTHLDEQTTERWIKNPITAGEHTFQWYFTAAHLTDGFRYYITKPTWNPNKPLTRDSFDIKPFCEIDGKGEKPSNPSLHNCIVPQRNGYQVILAVWDIADTPMAFYNVIDVKFNGNSPIPLWSQGGTISGKSLKIGEEVYTHVIDKNGSMRSDLSTRLKITSKEQGYSEVWSHDLAKKINAERTDIKAGELDGNTFTPEYGINKIYLQKDSGIARVELGYNINPLPDYDLTISGLEPQYPITIHPTVIDLSLLAKGNVIVELKINNDNLETLAHYTGELNDGDNHHISLELEKSDAGHHQLTMILKDLDGDVLKQTSNDFYLEPPHPADYDFVFPEGLLAYTAGTKVLAKDGIYQCRPFPHSGYCKQWSEVARQYEPGFGVHWTEAWSKLN